MGDDISLICVCYKEYLTEIADPFSDNYKRVHFKIDLDISTSLCIRSSQ